MGRVDSILSILRHVHVILLLVMMTTLHRGASVRAWSTTARRTTSASIRAAAFAFAPSSSSRPIGLPRSHQFVSSQYTAVSSSSSSSSRLFATSNEKTSSAASTSASASSSSFDEVLLTARKRAQEALALLDRNLQSSSSKSGSSTTTTTTTTTTTNVNQLQACLHDLEREQAHPTFWDETNTARAAVVNAQMATTSRLLTRIQQWQEYQGDILAALEILNDLETNNANADYDVEMRDMIVADLEQASTQLLLDSQRYELDLLLSGPYDTANARLVLTAGAGGTEANDWVADLRRMYERYCHYMKFTCTIQDEQPGDVVGYKSVELLIAGPNAYGWLSGEKGAHRLVRLSPFNANNKRQTTFAGVDVAPDILRAEDLKDVYISETDLEITTMRSGGKGGQNVNKVNSAVRIKHLPSGIQVKCSQERSQPLNKDIALARIKAQLLAIAQEERLDEIAQIRGDMVQASWGRQIRNYVLHPYKMVKDARTGWETSNAPAFLDGGELLEQCIGAHLRYKAEQQAKRQQEKEATS
jgi:peptide chain release factor 2